MTLRDRKARVDYGARWLAAVPTGDARPTTGNEEGATARQNSPCTSRTAPLPVQNSPCSPLLTARAVQNSPCSPKKAQFGGFCPSMANFVPLSPPTSRAGRTLYRCRRQQAMQGELCTECEAASGLAITAHQTPPVRRAWLRCPRAMAGPGGGTRGRKRHNRLPNFARNLSRSFFEMPQKRCNSNDANSKFE